VRRGIKTEGDQITTNKLTQLSFPFDCTLWASAKRRKRGKADLLTKFMGVQAATESPKIAVDLPRPSRREAIPAFTPFEHAVLSDLFRVRRPCIARGIDIWSVVDDKGQPLLNLEAKDFIHPEMPLRNAVAQIILEPLVDHLPNYYSVRTQQWARRPNIGVAGKPISLMPQHLLTIDWAGSGPGFGWPEAYYLTYVPGYDRLVVTASQDSSDAYGCEDFVLGWFHSRRDLKASAARVLTRFWRHAHKTWGQSKWEECVREGLLSAVEGKRLADRVWGKYHCW
jgi:hypothetical protein